MSMKIEISPGRVSLVIGDEHAKENDIEFKITLTGDEPALLRLEIPLGEDGVLLGEEDTNTIAVATPENPDYPPRVVNLASKDIKVWSLGNSTSGVAVSGSTMLSVSIRNILCRANAGESKIGVIAMAMRSRTKSTATLKIAKEKPKTWKNPILYFMAEPNFLISGEEVKLRWEVADANDYSVSLDFRGTSIPKPTSGMTYEPKNTGNFTLKFGDVTKTQNVEILSKNRWYESDPQLGGVLFPAVIFDAGGKAEDALYAIFVLFSKGDKNQTVRTPVLCQSANGITGWEKCDPSDVPEDMASSPGLRLKNRLYLIGGSSVDWDQKSKAICCYDLENPNTGWQDAQVSFSGMTGEPVEFEERMGHACVIVGDKIWVMGGSGRYGSLNDVWELTIDDKDKTGPIKIEARQIEPGIDASRDPKWDKKWAPRCMFSAVRYRNEIWVCGGVASPQGSALGGIYYRDMGSEDKTWKLRPEINETAVVKDAIGTGAALCGDMLFVLVTKSTASATDIHPTAIHKLVISTTTKDDWVPINVTPVSPADWTVSNHSITLVGFRNRLYLRYLQRNALRRNFAKDRLGLLSVYIT